MPNYRDGTFQRGTPEGQIVSAVTVSADNQQIDVTGIAWLQLSSDNATSTNRTIIIVPSTLVGHQLTIQYVGATNACEIQNQTGQRLFGTWTPLQYDFLELVSDGASWNETGRGTSGVNPAFVTKFAGKYTTLGGSATEAQTVTGVLSTDVVIATLNTKGATPRTILTAAPTTNTITYVFSGDPSTDHVVAYQILRAV